MRKLAAVFVLSAFSCGGYSVTGAQETVPIAPDNSGVNVRDRDAGAVTAGQQSNATSDVELTRKIRRAVVRDVCSRREDGAGSRMQTS